MSRSSPAAGRWALPGGFVRVGATREDQGEDLDAAAHRELLDQLYRDAVGNEADALIAATALVQGLALVTRNTRDFEGTGVVLIDPWRGGPTLAPR